MRTVYRKRLRATVTGRTQVYRAGLSWYVAFPLYTSRCETFEGAIRVATTPKGWEWQPASATSKSGGA